MEAESLYSRGFSGSSLSDSAWLSQADFRRLLPVCCPGWTTAVGTLRRRQPLPAAGRDAVDGARHRSRPRRQGLRVVHRVPAVRRQGDHDDDPRERCPRRLARRHDRRAAGVRFHGRQARKRTAERPPAGRAAAATCRWTIGGRLRTERPAGVLPLAGATAAPREAVSSRRSAAAPASSPTASRLVLEREVGISGDEEGGLKRVLARPLRALRRRREEASRAS